jgi:hypothetical protein
MLWGEIGWTPELELDGLTNLHAEAWREGDGGQIKVGL